MIALIVLSNFCYNATRYSPLHKNLLTIPVLQAQTPQIPEMWWLSGS